MSAGHSLRRGYAYGASLHSVTDTPRESSGGLPVIVIVTIVLIVAAIASDGVLASAVGQLIGTTWSDSIQFLLGVVSRVG